ncbi:hypothetical protein GPJ56_008242 [Histomonas meleagridis]|uniref:uncharacterized protein n=1 Tax=Histomonas meleagridis TaxID=135588 RepID=UPI003559A41B|nr:hypothetical protein GPJ56_008242 [Histomonas meleagridis]KAH0797264.1 hypothetical protein GO595_009946 [Histomonas meleagridis]
MYWGKAQPSYTELLNLVQTNPPDYEAILEDSDLIPLFSSGNKIFTSFLQNETNARYILQQLFSNENVKISQKIMQMSTSYSSPLLNYLITHHSFSESFIQNIECGDDVRIGYLSRIYSYAFDLRLDGIISLFSNSVPIIVSLLKCIHTSSIFSLIESYNNSIKPNMKWLPFVCLKLISPPGSNIPIPSYLSSYSNKIDSVFDQLSEYNFTNSHYSKMALLILHTLNTGKEPNFLNSLNDVLNGIYTQHNGIKVRNIIIELATLIPSAPGMKEIAIDLVKKPVPYDEDSVLSLKLLSKIADKSLENIVPDIIDRFINDKNNTFHAKAFCDFVRSAVDVPELLDILEEKFLPIAMEVGRKEKWRENAACVAYFLETSSLIGQHLANPSDEWNEFNETSLKEWGTRNEGLLRGNLKFESNYLEYEEEEEDDYEYDDIFFENDDDCFVVVGNNTEEINEDSEEQENNETTTNIQNTSCDETEPYVKYLKQLINTGKFQSAPLECIKKFKQPFCLSAEDVILFSKSK